MPVAILPDETQSIPLSRIMRFTADEYNRLTESGFFTTANRVELLEGWLVTKMPQNELHATSLDLLEGLLTNLMLEPWTFRTQRPVALTGDNVPEPDLVIVQGPKRRFFRGHPTPKDIALIIEVSDSSLEQDQGVKRVMYARDRLPVYWIVNLVNRQIEVYTLPRGGKNPGYRRTEIYGPNDAVPLMLDGTAVGSILVKELLP